MSEKQIILDQIKDHQQAIDKAKTELDALDKPQREGDYGYSENNHPRINFRNGGLFNSDGKIYSPMSADQIIKPTGNIFDDLARNSKDLEEFQVNADNVMSGFKAKIDSDGRIDMGGTRDTWHFLPSQAQEVHDNLGQLLATARRRQD
jgi:hypothetical protein